MGAVFLVSMAATLALCLALDSLVHWLRGGR